MVSTLLCAGVVAGGWFWMDGPGRRGVFLAAGIAWAVQLVGFAALVSRPVGSTGFLGAWVAWILVRFVTVGATAFAVSGREDVGILPALLTLVGLLLVLVLLEPIALRAGQENRTSNG